MYRHSLFCAALPPLHLLFCRSAALLRPLTPLLPFRIIPPALPLALLRRPSPSAFAAPAVAHLPPVLPPLFLLFLPFSRPSPSACAAPAVAHYIVALPLTLHLRLSPSVAPLLPLRIMLPALLRRSTTSVFIRCAALSAIFLFLPPVRSAFLPQRFAHARFCVIMVVC